MAAALETTKIATGTMKISKMKIGIPLLKAALKGKLTVGIKGLAVSKLAVALKKPIAAANPSNTATKLSSKPKFPTVATQYWAGADDDQGSDYNEIEAPEDVEDQQTKDEEDDEDDEAPRVFKTKAKTTGTPAAVPVPPNTLIQHPQDIIFVVPCHDQYGHDLTQKADVVINMIQAVIGSLKLPAAKRPPLVVKLNKNGTPRLALNTAQDWEQLKTDWLLDYNKKKVLIEVFTIMPKKAVKASMDSDNDDSGPDDGKDLKVEHSDDYNRKSALLKLWWPCKQHLGMVCLGDKTKGEHFVVSCINGTPGIDLDSPLHTDSFKEWYFKLSGITHRAGARMMEDKPLPSTNGGTHVTITCILRLFNATLSHHSANSMSPVQSPNMPDIGTWLSDLQVSADLLSVNWNKLTMKLENEDYLGMPLHTLAAFTSDLMRTGFGLTMQELSVVTEQLRKAAKQHRFVMRADMGKHCSN
ncbi:hypothetical protein K439DRAFT_1614235 [Ramaria rubella]|nr:hypothetical protein K439DRAFT_1614235 [Ramaria rubella]